MQRFFMSASKIDKDNRIIRIDGGDALHISHSLRMRIGDSIIVCDMQKNEYDCEIVSITSDTVTVKIITERKNNTEPPFKAYLYQALPKSDKFDFIVQKAVELGVYKIVPFESERCIVKLNRENTVKKRLRWQRIAEEAAKQCGRGIIPEVADVLSFSEAVNDASEGEIKFICYEGDGTVSLSRISSQNGEDIRFIIGPEGGFAQTELETALTYGLYAAGLGSRILRCETASGFVLSCLAYEKELKFME